MVMSNFALRSLALGIALPLAGATLAQSAPQMVGITAAIVNQVSIAGTGAAQFRRAALRDRVALADRVETGQRSQLQLLLLDKSVFNIGANARLTIDRFVYDPARGGSIGATVAKGAFRFMSGRRGDGNNSSIRTPVATIGIRGTIVEGVIGAEAIEIARDERVIGRNVRSDPETASLILLRGPGVLTQGSLTVGSISVEAGGASVTLDRPLQAAYVPAPGARPIGPFTISPQGLERINALVFPSLGQRWAAAARKPPKFRFSIGVSGSSGSDQQRGDGPRQSDMPRDQPKQTPSNNGQTGRD